jgi:hypothetical protein
MHVTVFRVFFYTISYRNLKLSMRFFWAKLQIEFAFHYCDPYGFGVTCLWISYYRTYACNSFPGHFSTPFHIGTWNFPWGFSELSYTSSLRFMVVTFVVSELCALGFITIGLMHVFHISFTCKCFCTTILHCKLYPQDQVSHTQN